MRSGRRRQRLADVLVALVCVGLVAACGARPSGPEATTEEIHLEPVATVGPQPFASSIAEVEGAQPPAPITGAGPAVDGGEPDLYGGTRDRRTCDPGALLAFLDAVPERAAAWARAAGTRRDEIDTFLATLTPVILRNDTRVTNHGYSEGRAQPRQAVLQTGTAVLVDPTGVPRVRCSCGNPLAEPLPVTLRYERDRWRGFDPSAIRTITPAPVPLRGFLLTDIDSGETFLRPAGTTGSFDTETGHRAG